MSSLERYLPSPDCCCGRGTMLLLCATERSKHLSRYFYKCPVDGRHQRNLIWCDDFKRTNINQRRAGNKRSSNLEGECSIFSDATSDSSRDGENRCRQLNKDHTGIMSTTTSDSIWFWVCVNMIVIFIAMSSVMIEFVVGMHYKNVNPAYRICIGFFRPT